MFEKDQLRESYYGMEYLNKLSQLLIKKQLIYYDLMELNYKHFLLIKYAKQ